ncbi:hypothetical protein GCK72_017966 [Caenorhabditis remanei]|uniref:receptor protein-tyrosine kinase n=1 Tax=Caenorhabditis remanei TaxID=31234 RepID=A0A6A5GA56_CAERE|nr:hypothetical protein GCK72_017966 [Caenorhabditis remanei]KAF1751412.1 hypothetical protein GCK72_017966 [Caenorhabditis remanei]
MRKKGLWGLRFVLFQFALVNAFLPNETFDETQYYAHRFDIREAGNGTETTYLIAAESRDDAVEKFSVLSSNCSLLSEVEEYSCKLDDKFCKYYNYPNYKTYKFQQNACECNVDSCDSETNSTKMILYPGCFCEHREEQCDFRTDNCPQWTEQSDHKELKFKIYPAKTLSYFQKFIQAGSATALLNRNKISMISSFPFRQSGFNCSLNFMHHFTYQSSSSRLVVRVLLKNGQNRTLYEYTHKPIKPLWVHTTVGIGSFSEPFRVSIDCETGSTKKKKTKQKDKVFACGLANIHFDDCMDIRDPVEKCSRGDQFLCSTPVNTKCLTDAQCDLKSDCVDGSDEMECGSVTGTMCNFDSSDGFCDGWLQTTRIIGPQQINDPNSATPLNKFDEPLSYLLRKRMSSPSTLREARRGSGQMLVYDYDSVAMLSRRISVLQSPVFPRTNPLAYDKNSHLFETCTLRFFVCSRTYHKTWEIAIISKAGNPFDSGTTTLYEGTYDPTHPEDSGCRWERVLIRVPRQNAGFRLGIFVNNFPRNDFFAIDDLSFSPTCFEKSINQSTWEIPDLTVSTCGTSGSDKPLSCGRDRELDGQTGHFLKEDGSQEWTVPVEGFYRIDACGAGGGSTNTGNGDPGDCVTLQVHLMENIALRMIVGQVGESACLTEQEEEFRPASCSKITHKERRHNDGGAGGGGATLIKFESNQWNVVVGGGAGAGASWTDYGDDEDDFDSVGYGTSVVPNDYDEKCNVTCKSISHTEFSEVNLERCENSKGDQQTIFGGFGGGGSSCGMLGGSGAGYRAGNPFGKGRERSGTSNVTDNFSKDVMYFQSNKVEEGYIKIRFCRKQCPKPSICRFRKDYYDEEYCGCPDGSNFTDSADSCACPLACPESSTCQYRNFTFEPFCLCNNGKLLEDMSIDLCEIAESRHWSWYLMSIVVFVAAFLSPFFAYNWKKSRQTLKKQEVAMRDFIPPEPTYDDIYFGQTTRKEALDSLETIPRDAITRGRVLGRGNFGEVYYGEYNGSKVAVKMISRTFSASQSSQADFYNEALCMGTFQNNNIVRLIGIDFDSQPFMIAIEYMEGGDLLSFVKDSRPNQHSLNPLHLAMSDLVKLCYDVGAGCRFLESVGYVHRDIAARNILLSTRGMNRVAKIADFGMAKAISNGSEYYRVHGRAMLPIKWTPPESFIDGVFTTKSDVWSFGILCWEVFSLGVVPYPNRRNEEVMLMLTEGGRLEYPYGIPTRVYQMMRECWRTSADSRPTFSSIVETIEDILKDPASVGMAFPIHPTVRASFAHSQSTPVSVETPMTAMTDVSLNSTFTDASTVKMTTAQQDMQDRINFPQPEYLSPNSIDESVQLIPSSNTLTEQTPPTSLIDLNRLAVQNTGPALHRPDSLNFNDPYSSVPLLEIQTR